MLTLGAVAGTSAPALAADTPAAPGPDGTVVIYAAPSSCTYQSLCGYVDNSYQTGEGYELIPEQAPPSACNVLAHRNKWTSVYNNTSRTVRLYLNTTCTGSSGVQYKTIGPGTGIQYLWITWSPSWNDTLDAAQFV